jgi:ParB family chromosome partitioning protein
MKTSLVNLITNTIRVGKNNPRKTFDSEKIKELAQSITSNGVLQPIVVRTTEKENIYELVCGERRLRACLEAGVYEIPAVVHHDLDDAKAIEMQIAENLQRVDVHPMEEAAAFQKLILVNDFTVEEICFRLGKTKKYVGQRLIFMNLIDPFQKAFFDNRGDFEFFTKMARLKKELQEELYNEDFAEERGQYSINDWALSKYVGKLGEAPFDLTVPLFGKPACATCEFNTQSSTSLFPDENKAMCSNVSCFKSKMNADFDLKLEQAKAAAIQLVSCNYSYDHGGLAQKLIKAGFPVLLKSEYNYESLSKPELSDFEENFLDGDYDTREEMLKAYNEEMKEYTDEMTTMQEEIASGVRIKALVVEGSEKGHWWYIRISKSKNKKTIPQTEDDKGPTLLELSEEIDRIKSRVSRNEELDEEKNQEAIYKTLAAADDFVKDTTDLILEEQRALFDALFNIVGHEADDFVKEVLGSKKFQLRRYNYKDWVTNINSISTDQLTKVNNILMRFFIATKAKPFKGQRPSKNPEAYFFNKIVEKRYPDEYKFIQDQIAEDRAKRKLKTDKRIKEIEAQMQALKPKKNPAKKPAGKKSTAKAAKKK